MAGSKGKSIRAFISHALGFVAILGLLLVLIACAVSLRLAYRMSFDTAPGYPESAEKSVSIYQQTSANPSGITVYLHPPLNSIQAPGESQQVAFQFVNHGAPAKVTDLQLSPIGCMQLTLEPAAGGIPQKLPLNLAKGQSVVYWYRLSVADSKDSCLGQFPLVFHANWQLQSPAKTPLEQQSVSTGPILVTTHERLGWERFYNLIGKIVPLILLPVLLALATMLFQHLQEQRGEQQKVQEQKLEVWKTILPGIIEAIRNHYIPMLSIISIMKDEASQTTPDTDDLLACALLLRNKVTHLVRTSGGFYFKNRRGEKICASLSNELMSRFYVLSGNPTAFRNEALLIPPKSLFAEAQKRMLRNSSVTGSALPQIRKDFATAIAKAGELEHLRAHLEMVYEILNYEANEPFYPQWYDEREPLNTGKLEVADLGLDAVTEKEMEGKMKSYLESVPAK